MQLTRQTDFGLRILVFLALENDRLVKLEQIATAHEISYSHLLKISHRLVEFGYIQTLRGRRGGVRLAQEPADIRVGDVIRDLEGQFALADCMETKANTCRIAPMCRIRSIYWEALEAFFDILSRYTIADLAKQRPELRAALALSTCSS